MAQIKKNDPKMHRVAHSADRPAKTDAQGKSKYLTDWATNGVGISGAKPSTYKVHSTSGSSYTNKGMGFNKGGKTKSVGEMSTNREAARKAERRARQSRAKQQVAQQVAGYSTKPVDNKTVSTGEVITMNPTEIAEFHKKIGL